MPPASLNQVELAAFLEAADRLGMELFSNDKSDTDESQVVNTQSDPEEDTTVGDLTITESFDGVQTKEVPSATEQDQGHMLTSEEEENYIQNNSINREDTAEPETFLPPNAVKMENIPDKLETGDFADSIVEEAGEVLEEEPMEVETELKVEHIPDARMSQFEEYGIGEWNYVLQNEVKYS